MFESDMGMHATQPPGSGSDPGDDSDSTGLPLADLLTADAANCPPRVRHLVELLAEICQEPLVGGLVSGAALAARLAVLARARLVLDAEIGRTLAAAERGGVLPFTPGTFLQREAHWSGSAAGATVAASRLADRHRDLAQLWQSGRVPSESLAVIARELKGLPVAVEQKFLAACLPQLPQISVAGVRVLTRRFLDLLHPDDRDAQEQTDWERRTLTVTKHGGMAMLHGEFPDLEGEAILAALDALADSLRVENDHRHNGQRRADALITLVNRAASYGDVPATRSGLPVATTITVGISEADRVAAGQSRSGIRDLAQDVADGIDPGALAVSGGGNPLTLGDAAVRFALCTGEHTGVVIDDGVSSGGSISRALGITQVQPLAIGRKLRLATPAQRTALALRDRGCVMCGRPPSECQTHHLTDWSAGGRTDVDQLVLLCWVHHREVDLNRWTICRNPETDPYEPRWLITPVPRHQWRRRRPHAA